MQPHQASAVGGIPVVVSPRIVDILSEEIEERIQTLIDTLPKGSLTLKDKLTIWLATYQSSLKSQAKDEMQEIIDSLD